MCMFVSDHVCHLVNVDVRGQLVYMTFLLLWYESQVSTSSYQHCHKAPLPNELLF